MRVLTDENIYQPMVTMLRACGHDVIDIEARRCCIVSIVPSMWCFEVLSMDNADLEQRTKTFALRMIRFVSTWPKSKVAE